MTVTTGNTAVPNRSDRLSVSPSRGRRSVLDEDDEILEITEKHGALYNAIPCMPLPVAIVFCIFNIIVPGLGEYVVMSGYSRRLWGEMI